MRIWSKRRSGDAEQAKRDAADGLREAHERWPEVRRVSSSLRELRERNHFAEAFEQAFKKGKTT